MEDRLFDGQVLPDRLGDEGRAGGDLGERADGAHVRGILGEGGDRLGEGRLGDVEEPHRMSAAGKDGGEGATHETGADDADGERAG